MVTGFLPRASASELRFGFCENSRVDPFGPLMAWLLNVLLPGAGLILRRREWLGLSMAVLFAICGHIVIAGFLIAPETIPSWLVRLAVSLVVLAWCLSQYLCYRQGLIFARTRRGLSNLLSEAHAAMKANDLAAAERALDSGLALDDEEVELHVLRARMFGLTGDRPAMLNEWRRVLKLDRHKRYRDEARDAMQKS
ncbi:MAG: hypothetical protein MI923_07165 [Phycisphaerales bacterium]|nr:hypothetical protein [Phycisphaerales bacterium]